MTYQNSNRSWRNIFDQLCSRVGTQDRMIAAVAERVHLRMNAETRWSDLWAQWHASLWCWLRSKYKTIVQGQCTYLSNSTYGVHPFILQRSGNDQCSSQSNGRLGSIFYFPMVNFIPIRHFQTDSEPYCWSRQPWARWPISSWAHHCVVTVHSGWDPYTHALWDCTTTTREIEEDAGPLTAFVDCCDTEDD